MFDYFRKSSGSYFHEAPTLAQCSIHLYAWAAKMQDLPLSLPALCHCVPLGSSHHQCVEKVCSGLLCRWWIGASLGQDQAHCSHNMMVEPNQKDQVLAPETSDETAGSLLATRCLTCSLEMVCMTLQLDQQALGFAKHFLPCLGF